MPVLERLIWQIETDLNSEMSLRSLSERCAVNIHHMCRVFQHATGMSIMSYTRARKLSKAARAIVSGNDSIIAVALDAGYGSHEAFTRAFASYFGTTPSSLRKEHFAANLDLMEPFEMNKDMIVPVSAPRKQERAAFNVIGLGTDCSFAQTGNIPAVWQSFNAREEEVAGAVPGATYGVCCMADEAGNFRYIAGVEATGSTPAMERVDLPSQLYAVFTHTGHISDLPKTVYTIWNKVLPESGLEAAKAPDFEKYDHRFDGQTGRGEVEVWIPIIS
ncbi:MULTISPECIES: GyrI-like domain-containing protein [Agrobacterium]|jgi:AraC family transcriptional regulator|uniref:AraC family transcriptional regulator n=1 Tax=Agrobacterium pusense TaxID=648995 RepID=A0AA44EHE4_9HYPH|nr:MULTISPECIES: AraC family transcriptional regulator [unclassified Agrobacterium]NRF07386.1 AraC family transcriptional regulator [Agrobacterium pusense]MDH0617108.1 AraC family transcriptional regulator [Agrobacterium sp. GD03872]MDH0699859.1 AraC family transcriptional regulator [Agrobacterium sp. GD03871]MDH1062756.1 AraC family transcriptional regulator [Agrobacterium sp. GD03992]MDH2214020.1 AraC family transcriptional regulator [Agrobacterium sp. GD03643]